jgi:metal-sulfur cluster biosynthetic enzyme
MIDTNELEKKVMDSLKNVIDPETGVDVISMRLVENLQIDQNGCVSYIFRPSSPLCPIAVPLAQMIIQAIEPLEGVTSQHIEVRDYIEANNLTRLLNSLFE